MSCPSHSISYNGSHCACAVGHLLNQTSNTCVLFAANSTISIDSGIDIYAISFPETIFSFDSIKKFTQSQTVFLQATFVLLLSWLAFCFFLRFMKLGNDGANLSKSINSLEKLLDAKVYSVEDKEELDRFVASPVIRVYHYDPVISGTSSPYMTYSSKLEQMKRQCIAELSRRKSDPQSLRSRNVK